MEPLSLAKCSPAAIKKPPLKIKNHFQASAQPGVFRE
jgi:hypothetical protein